MKRSLVSAMFLLVMVISGCSEDRKQSQQAPSQAAESRAVNLKKLMAKFQGHVLSDHDEMAIDYARKLFPTQETLAIACESEKNPADYQIISEWIELTKPRNSQNFLKIYPLRPWQTEIIVSSTTGAELASEAGELKGFHEKAGELARSGLLRPDREFFSVEFRKPGDKVGQRYELFVWDPERMAWKMLGPIWRALSVPGKS